MSAASKNVTGKLLELHRIESQIRGLTKRLGEAERALGSQNRLYGDLMAQADALRAQIRQLEVAAANDEGEVKRLDERIGKLREQMNAAKTNKEYTSFQTEISTLKADRGQFEEKAIGSLSKLDTLRNSLKEVETQRADRKTMVDAAVNERDRRRDEIKDRLDELSAQRKVAADDVPAHALAAFEQRVALGDEDVMAPLEEHDRRNREYVCGSCQVLVPMEKLNGLLGRGELTMCSSCGVILYLEAATRDAALAGKK